jgi:hypothetical protein
VRYNRKEARLQRLVLTACPDERSEIGKQEPDMRLDKWDEIAQHIDVQTREAENLSSRSGSDWPKEDALTRGGHGCECRCGCGCGGIWECVR